MTQKMTAVLQIEVLRSVPSPTRKKTEWMHTSAVLVVALLALMPLLIPLARADTILVETTDDVTSVTCSPTSNQGEWRCNSLRAAIVLSNSSPQQSRSFTILLLDKPYYTRQQANPRPFPTIVGTVTIRGKGASRTSIHGVCNGKTQTDEAQRDAWECGSPNAEGPVLSVGEKGSLFLEDLTVQEGQDGSAGGIYNAGTAILVRTTVKHNHSHFGGGGITNTGYLNIEDSTISHNASHFNSGGGIQNIGTGRVVIVGSTIDHRRLRWWDLQRRH